MRWQGFTGALLCVLVGFAAPPARAEESAREHFDRGTAAFALGRYAEAAADYERAFELKPDPALLYNAAQAHRLAGNKRRALFLYQSYLSVYKPRGEQRDEVARHVAELKRAVEAEPAVAPARPEPAPRAGEPRPPATTAPAAPATPATTAPATTAAPALALTAPPPSEAPRKRRAWVWGVVAGSVVAVGLGLGLGLGFGLSGGGAPSPTLGALTLR